VVPGWGTYPPFDSILLLTPEGFTEMTVSPAIERASPNFLWGPNRQALYFGNDKRQLARWDATTWQLEQQLSPPGAVAQTSDGRWWSFAPEVLSEEGWNVHAAVKVERGDADGRERLCLGGCSTRRPFTARLASVIPSRPEHGSWLQSMHPAHEPRPQSSFPGAIEPGHFGVKDGAVLAERSRQNMPHGTSGAFRRNSSCPIVD